MTDRMLSDEIMLGLIKKNGGGGGGTSNYNQLENLPQIGGVTLRGNKSASDLGLASATALANKVDKVTGKGLSTNDFTDEYKAAIGSNTTAITAIKDGTDLDSFGDVEVALLDKADTSDLGTAAAKDSTNSVTAGSTDLVESGAVKDAIDAAVAAAYHHAGTKTVAQLTHDLLIAANEGNVYNITDSGTTTSDFIEGIGKQIDAGDNVGICKVGNVYMFDLLSGLEDTSIFVQKSQTAGLLKNDGTVNTTIEDTVAGHTTAIAGKVDKVNGKGLSTNDFTDDYKDKVDNNKGAIEAIVNECGAKNLFRMLKSPITSAGITITPVNGEYITISGTPTQRVDISIHDDSWSLSEINTFIGSYDSTATIEIYAQIEHTGQSTRYIKLAESGAQFDITDGDRLARVFVRIYADQSLNGEVIKPMIRDARITDPTYVPYAMTNKELTGAVDQLKSGLTNLSRRSSGVSVSAINTDGATYTAPSDGYLCGTITGNDSQSGYISVNDTEIASTVSTTGTAIMIFVKSGDVIKSRSSIGTYDVRFYPWA